MSEESSRIHGRARCGGGGPFVVVVVVVVGACFSNVTNFSPKLIMDPTLWSTQGACFITNVRAASITAFTAQTGKRSWKISGASSISSISPSPDLP